MIKPVGGLFEKICEVIQAGFKAVIMPRDNINDIPADIKGIKIMPVDIIQEVIKIAFEGDEHGTGH